MRRSTSSSLTVGPPDPPKLINASIFNEARLKVFRARRHIHEASVVIQANIKSHEGELGVQFDPSDGSHNLSGNIHISAEVALAVGDCVHCLRGALDYLVSSLARAAQLSNERTLFPFHDKRENVEDMFRAKVVRADKKDIPAGPLHALGCAYPDLQNVILENIQPYNRDDGANPLGDMLWRITRMDNIDKHRLITPVVQMTNASGTIAGAIISNVNFSGFAPGTTPIGVRGADPEAQSEMTLRVGVEFPNGTLLAGQPVINTLVEAGNLVAQVIEIFETHFQGSNPAL